MNNNSKIFSGFTSGESQNFKYKVGKMLASSLSGFIAGVIATTIFWIVAIVFLFK
jgi:hypothetical protein